MLYLDLNAKIVTVLKYIFVYFCLCTFFCFITTTNSHSLIFHHF